MVDITWILKAVDALKDTDLKIKISELVTENLSLKNDNFDLKKKIDAIDEIKTITSQLFVRDKMYFQKKDSQEDGPFCTKCWGDEKKLIYDHLEHLLLVAKRIKLGSNTLFEFSCLKI